MSEVGSIGGHESKKKGWKWRGGRREMRERIIGEGEKREKGSQVVREVWEI